MDEWHEKGIGRARAQRSGARYRNRCARDGVGRDGARGVHHEAHGDHGGFLGGGWRAGGDLTETRRHGGFGDGIGLGGEFCVWGRFGVGWWGGFLG